MTRTTARGLAAAGVLAAGAGVAQAQDVYEVELVLFSFMYDGQSNLDIDLTIQTGDTVKWVWVSGLHNVVSGMPGDKDAGELFFSGKPEFGAVFEHTFEEPGEYFYHCHEHQDFGMISSVVVEEAGCPADVNGDGVLNILDFVEFQSLFQQMDPFADCNEDGQFNVLDFVCFQNLFQQGCP